MSNVKIDQGHCHHQGQHQVSQLHPGQFQENSLEKSLPEEQPLHLWIDDTTMTTKYP